MFTSIVFTAVLASGAVLLSQAIVLPSLPAPGDIFNEGSTCHIGWVGDDSGTKAWSDMKIELMTGSNMAMVVLTTVAQHQDGSTEGVYEYTCPQVTPNSPIYFYQFTAAGTTNITWTGRFTIAGADGSSSPATETDGTVAYGNGILVGGGSSSAARSNSTSAHSPTGPSPTSTGLSPTSSGPSNPGAAPGSNTSSPTLAKTKDLAGPIAGGVIGGLLLLCVLGSLVYQAHRRRQTNNPAFAPLDDKEGQPSTPLPHTLPRTSVSTTDLPHEVQTPEPYSILTILPNGQTQLSPANQPLPPALLAAQEKYAHAPTTDLPHEERTPEPYSALATLPNGQTQLSPANQLIPPALLASQEKYALREQEIPDIVEEARATASLPAQFAPASPSQFTALSVEETNANLVAQIRLLREQMNAMQQQMNPPGYTAANPGVSV